MVLTVGNLRTWTVTGGIFGLIVGTFIGICSGSGIVYSGVGLGSGVGMTGGVRGIAYCRRFSMDSNMLDGMSP